jgi:inner membrane transporter RhtA
MIVGTSLTIQLGAALAHGLFAELGPGGASAVRFSLGALVLVAVVRPAIRGRDWTTWCAITAYGVSLAALNLTFFAAISRVPMGIAVTLSFTAPLLMAVLRSRARHDFVLALLAGAGVAVLGGVDRPGSLPGVGFAVAAGIAWVAVAYAGRSVGRHTRRLEGLALAVPIAAVITFPLAVERRGALDGQTVAIGLAIAVIGLIVPFALELEGLRRLEPRTVAIIYSIDPAIAAVIGLFALGEHLTALQFIALIVVVVASAAATCLAASSSVPRRPFRARTAPSVPRPDSA